MADRTMRVRPKKNDPLASDERKRWRRAKLFQRLRREVRPCRREKSEKRLKERDEKLESITTLIQ